MSTIAPPQSESTGNRQLNLVQVWFSYSGRLKAFDFWTKGFAPGILLGIAVVRIDAEADAHGLVIYPYLLFSLWPLSAMLVKLWRDSRSSRPISA